MKYIFFKWFASKCRVQKIISLQFFFLIDIQCYLCFQETPVIVVSIATVISFNVYSNYGKVCFVMKLHSYFFFLFFYLGCCLVLLSCINSFNSLVLTLSLQTFFFTFLIKISSFEIFSKSFGKRYLQKKVLFV